MKLLGLLAFGVFCLHTCHCGDDHDKVKVPYYDKKLPIYDKKLTFQLTFPMSSGRNPYVKLLPSIPAPLDRFTLCYWVRPHSELANTVFSYAVDGSFNEIWTGVSPNSGVSFARGNGDYGVKTSVNVRPDEWIHVCITWSAISGKSEVFLYGKSIRVQSGTAYGRLVKPGGVIVIGQGQHTVGGGFQDNEAWKGDISELHMWDYVLSHKDISYLAGCTLGREGNVVSWFRSRKSLHQGVEMSPVRLPCKD